MPDKATERQAANDALWNQDLRPDFQAGRNRGMEGANPEKAEGLSTAYDIKALHRRLEGYTDDELKQITVLPQGARLEQGATYIDLRADDCRELTARADMEAGPENWYVPKSEVDYRLWNRLIGVDNPERTGQADK